MQVPQEAGMESEVSKQLEQGQVVVTVRLCLSYVCYLVTFTVTMFFIAAGRMDMI